MEWLGSAALVGCIQVHKYNGQQINSPPPPYPMLTPATEKKILSSMYPTY